MTIGEFFGTLQEAITVEWRKHLQTGKYSDHMALDEFYKEMPEKVDALIEAWQADNDIVKDYANVLDEDLDALAYMEALKKHVKEGRKLLESSELESLCDDILSCIDSTIYKLKHLKESLHPLTSFLKEALEIDEAANTWGDIVGMVQKIIDAAAPAEKNRWGAATTAYGENVDLSVIQKLIKKNKPVVIKKADEDNKSAWVGVTTEKGEVIKIEFSDTRRRSTLYRARAENVTFSRPMTGSDCCWATSPGERVTVYECPEDITQQIYDIVQTKY